MKDIVVVACLVVAFAAFVTAHVAIVAGLAARRPRWRAPVGLLVPPLALLWAFRERMRVRAIAATAAVVVYAVARVMASF